MLFKDLNLNPLILENIEAMGYNELTEIQEKAIPKIQSGRDIIGIAQTGTGKTAAFALPILDKLLKEEPKKETKILIITPTRELAIQIRDNIMAYRKGTDFKCSVVLGGINKHSQKAVIKKGFEILVATPGRLKDLLETRKIRLETVKTVVLDEADTMLDMGFIHDITYIMEKTPKSRQTLLFSATMPDTVKKLANKIMNIPETIKVNTLLPKEKISQEVYFISKLKKIDLLFDLITTRDQPSTIIFCRTKQAVNELEEALSVYNMKISVLHGDKMQQQRIKAMRDFKEGKNKILIATDVAARGIDVEDLGLVINYDVPTKKELYIHRIGRTARAGKVGRAVTMCSTTELRDLRDIEKAIGLTLTPVEHKYKSKQEKAKEQVRRQKEGRKKEYKKGEGPKFSDNKKYGSKPTDKKYGSKEKKRTNERGRNNKKGSTNPRGKRKNSR